MTPETSFRPVNQFFDVNKFEVIHRNESKSLCTLKKNQSFS